jgi:hypothetical protein
MAEKADEKDERPRTFVMEKVVTREVSEPAPGPNATTEIKDPETHYFLASDGKTKVNAFGEVKGSPEDKIRW